MSLEPLSAEALRAALAALPGWSLTDAGLNRRWVFDDFTTAMAFMADCVEDIERLDHHPRWDNLFTAVQCQLATHDAGDQVTAKDVELAKVLAWRAAALGGR